MKMKFDDVLHGLTWPGENLTKFDHSWHGEIRWNYNHGTGLAYGRCVRCRRIITLQDPGTFRPALVKVEFGSEQWLILRARRAA